MRTVRPISEDEMVAVFLQGEVSSPRFGEGLTTYLREQGIDPGVVFRPDLGSSAENETRRQILGHLRGYQRETSLFRGFPVGVGWERAMVTGTELSHVRYINYDYWVELSGGTRRPADAAKRIRQGVEIFRQPNAPKWNAVEALKSGVQFRELILVTNDRKKLVVLEGHVRLTAFALEPDLRPKELEVILGSSEHMTNWPLY